MATAAKALRPGHQIVGVQTDALSPPCTTPCRAPTTRRALDHCRGHCRGHAGQITVPEVVARPGGRPVLVDEGDIEQAVLMLLEIRRKPWWRARGAVGLAALPALPRAFCRRAQRVGLVLCGGNIDPLLLPAIIERGMVRSGGWRASA